MRRQDLQAYEAGVYIAERIPNLGITRALGVAAPTNGAVGYCPGCIWQNVSLAFAELTSWYVNTGTLASATWQAGNTMPGLLATVTELNRAADMSNRIIPITSGSSATLAITEAAHDDRTIYVTKTDGWNATLPVPVAGMKFRIIIGATIATASTIKSVSGAHIMIGHAQMGNNSDNTVVLWQATASNTYDTIDLLGTANSTGGIEGQSITIEAMSATVWMVEIVGDAAGTEATPFADTVA